MTLLVLLMLSISSHGLPLLGLASRLEVPGLVRPDRYRHSKVQTSSKTSQALNLLPIFTDASNLFKFTRNQVAKVPKLNNIKANEMLNLNSYLGYNLMMKSNF